MRRDGAATDQPLTCLVIAAGVQPLAGYLVSLLAVQLLEHCPAPLPSGTRATAAEGVLPADSTAPTREIPGGGRVNVQVRDGAAPVDQMS